MGLNESEPSYLAQQLRNETPGATRVTHFNNAGCSLPPQAVIDAQIAYIEQESLLGGYEAAARFANGANEFYTYGAKVLGCDPEEIGLCQSATDAWRKILYSLSLPKGSTIAFDESIYGGNLLALTEGRDRFGWRLLPVDINESGTIDLRHLAQVLREESVSLLAITHMPAQSGALNPLGEIAQLASKSRCLTVVDACQSLGHAPIDLAKESVDGLVFTGRKYLRAPRGTGGYFLRADVAANTVPLGPDIRVAEITSDHSDWQMLPAVPRLEQWERNWSSMMGAAEALKYLSNLDADWIWKRIAMMARSVVEALAPISGVQVRRRSAEEGGIVVFDLPGRDLVDARDWLRASGVNTMFAGPQNAPIEMLRHGERGWLRVSVHYYNTQEDVERLAAAVAEYLADRPKPRLG